MSDPTQTTSPINEELDKKDLAQLQASVAALGLDPKVVDSQAGLATKIVVEVLNRAIGLQSSLITTYVDRLRLAHSEETPAQIQARMDKHFLRLASGSGAGAGATAAVPGLGLIAASGAIAGESVIFIDAASFYAMASAYLRGGDITVPERRRTLILLVLLGAQGSALVDALIGDIAIAGTSRNTAALVNRVGLPGLKSLNNTLFSTAVRRLSKRLMRGWIGKLMPLGIGAVLGWRANRKLARGLVENVHHALGAPPESFARPVERGIDKPKKPNKR